MLHDDQHATAVVALATLMNATRIAGRELDKLVVGIIGLGAAGLGIARLLSAYGVHHFIGTDLRHEAMGRLASLGGQGVTLEETLKRADVVIATTGAKGLIKPEMVRRGQIVLALSNPDPEIEPALALAQGLRWRRTARASTTCWRSRACSPALCARGRRASTTPC